MAAQTFKRVAELSPYAILFFEKTKEIPAFQKMYSKVGLTAPPADLTKHPLIGNMSNTNNNTATSHTNTTFSQTNIVQAFVEDPEQVEKAMSFIETLVSSAPAVGAYASLLSCAVQFLHDQQAIAELRKMNEHLGRSADAAWGKFSYGDEFPQHVYKFVRYEIKSSIKRNPPKKEGAINECFFLFNGGNEFYSEFDDQCELRPLPDGFFGTFRNLDVLIALIRDVLRPAMGPEMLFTILMPVKSNMVSLEPVMLPRGIGPLRFKGEIQENGEPRVYMNLCRLEDSTELDGVGNIPIATNVLPLRLVEPVAFFGTMMPYMAICAGVSFIPVIGLPVCAVAWMGGGSYIAISVSDSVHQRWTIKVRVLGTEETHIYDPPKL